jgi:transcription initiation factor IIE alpha subunit
MELFDALSNLISERKEIESNYSSNLLKIANALYVEALDPEKEIFYKVILKIKDILKPKNYFQSFPHPTRMTYESTMEYHFLF